MATTVTLKPNAIDLSGSTSGTTTLQPSAVAGTTTITLPAATDTLVGKATTDTLTNKTLTSPTITGGALNGTLGATTPSTVAATSITASTTLGVTGTATLTVDASISGLTVGKGGGAVSTNTAIGASALNNGSLSGGDNFGAGYNSAQGLTTGVRNTILGSQSGQNLTTGSDNILIGYRTVYNAASTGSNNVALGNQAGYAVTTGEYNTYLGGTAAVAATTGTRNTFIGYGSGNAVTTGDRTTILGRYSGNQGGLDIRTASNYIVLSDGDGNPLISTNSTRSVALNGAVPQTGTGITFPTTQSASSDANTLDDYEEGTWTPSIGGTATYGFQDGRYTKIGNFVKLSFLLSVTLKGTGSSQAITGIPFSPSNSNPSIIGGIVCYASGLATSANILGIYAQSTGNIYFFSRDGAGTGATTQQVSVIGNSFLCYCEVSYTV